MFNIDQDQINLGKQEKHVIVFEALSVPNKFSKFYIYMETHKCYKYYTRKYLSQVNLYFIKWIFYYVPYICYSNSIFIVHIIVVYSVTWVVSNKHIRLPYDWFTNSLMITLRFSSQKNFLKQCGLFLALCKFSPSKRKLKIQCKKVKIEIRASHILRAKLLFNVPFGQSDLDVTYGNDGRNML